MRDLLLFAALIACIAFVGHLNWRDIEHCKSLGNSEETCIATFNP